ncbi:hypothetical protein BCT06_12665 [Vibrio breoganii]|uniref:hypothetical protein n=1 Tax=Vibrio breoganii TaxID=553239 RepID=UPI000C83966D|nr:hypothetical protein [Vibrio breoganii]PMO60342.1 hypothetical protein BCT06_12665 [Vibrio breoganii]
MPVSFSDIERNFIDLVNKSQSFEYNGDSYDVVGAWKPSPSQGECKTDVFIQTKQNKDFKISIKKSNADFLENKISRERAVQIFGNNADEIISKSTKSIHNSFNTHPLISFSRNGRTEEKTIILGWKFELMNKKSGDKSGKLVLTDEQKSDVYSGVNLSEDKKHSFVNGSRINNSGVAEYILIIDRIEKNLQHYIDNIVDIQNYAKDVDLYFACKALNYRSLKDKWDGNRPLAVYVNWKLEGDEVVGEVVYDQPLSVKGDEVGNKVRDILNKLNINKSNFDSLKQRYKGNSYP